MKKSTKKVYSGSTKAFHDAGIKRLFLIGSNLRSTKEAVDKANKIATVIATELIKGSESFARAAKRHTIKYKDLKSSMGSYADMIPTESTHYTKATNVKSGGKVDSLYLQRKPFKTLIEKVTGLRSSRAFAEALQYVVETKLLKIIRISAQITETAAKAKTIKGSILEIASQK